MKGMPRFLRLKKYIFGVFFLCLFMTPAWSGVIYVNRAASTGGDGQSWGSAFCFLQDALQVASSGDKIYVADGVYKPDEGNGITDNDRSATFLIPDGIELYGGFPSSGTPDWEDRDPSTHQTILSGDIDGNDTAGFGDRESNSLHIVTCDGVSSNTCISGFQIYGGYNQNTYKGGGGLYNNNSDTVVSDCLFVENDARNGGALLSGGTSSIQIENCIFYTNRAANAGGGVRNNQPEAFAKILRCEFKGNWGRWAGGAIYNYRGDATIDHCVFEENKSDGYGGGAIHSDQVESSTLVLNSFFQKNTATERGGALYLRNLACLVASNCTFLANTAQIDGGAIYHKGDQLELTNCQLFGNEANDDGGGIAAENANKVSVFNSIATANEASDKGGALFFNAVSTGSVINCSFSKNSASSGGAVLLYGSSTRCKMYNSICWENSASSGSNICIESSATLSVGSSLLEGGISAIPVSGTLQDEGGILDLDPLFYDVRGSDYAYGTLDDNLALRPTSPAIDSGSNAKLPASATVDLDGNPRIIKNTVDMGAYERQTIHYIAYNSSPKKPYSTWATATYSLTKAIDECIDGDTVVISNGVWFSWSASGILVSKNITIRSLNGPEATSLTGHDDYPCFVLGASHCRIEGLSIRNAKGDSGAGVYCYDHTPYVSNCIIFNCVGDMGGGMYKGTAVDCTFSNNIATGEYGFGGGAFNTLATNCLFSNNRSEGDPSSSSYGMGGGMKDGTAYQCVFRQNYSTRVGGGQSSGTSVGSIYENNSATEGGGAYLTTISDGIISNNHAFSSGGGSYAGTASNCLFKSNSSLSGGGGGALLTSLVECQLIENVAKQGGGLSYGTATNTLFLNNSASDNGGGVFDGKITNCTLVGNTSTKSGGGLCYGFAADCLFSNNLAKESGGGILGGYVVGSGPPRGTATNCTFVKNRSLHSGGGMDRGLAHYCRFDRNIASGYGGGMNSGTANHCVFIRNSAGYGGGGMAGGDSAGVANVCVFVGNTATNYGGGGMDGGLANHCTFTANSVLKQVGGFGGGMVNGSASNCIFKGNWVWDREENIRSVSAHSCCAAELVGGINGCISVDPLLITASHLSATSPCIGAGVTNDLAQTDIDGELWAASPAMGCDEYYSGTHGKPELFLFLSDRFAQNGSFPIRYTVLGSASTVLLDLGDGTILTNQLSALHAWSSTGSFEVVLTAFSEDFPEGISVTQRVEIVEPILHVSPDGNDNYDGLSWATAKKTIQNAVNHSEMSACPTILVTNGTYFSEIVVTNALTIRSVNGPLSTIIDGNSSHKCFQLGTVECEIIGFTLQNGVSSTLGGGIYCTDSKPLISNCIFYKNHAKFGGGLYWGRVQNSLFVGNSVESSGGAIALSSAQNCTIINNVSKNKGAGIYQGAATNCIIYYNLANMRENNLSETPSYYTCSPELNSSFTGCITNEPLLASSSHLSTNSPCVGAGTAEKSEGTDLGGVAWNTPPSMGCDEFSAETHGDLTLSLSLPSQIAEGANARICSTILGAASCSILETSDGSVVSNRSAWVHAWNTPGIYSIRLTAFNNDHPSGVSITQQISVVSTPLYVSSLMGNDANDGLSWATAKQTIQAAVNIAQVPGQQIWVSNGVYHLSNEISVDKYVRIQGLNGAEKTILDGAGAHRCFYLGINAPETVLSEMTFTNGHATTYDYGGAGILAFCDQTTVKDAIFTHNIVTGGGTGGGMRGGHVVNCIFENNSAEYGGGLYDGTALGCSFLENQVTGPVENSPYGGGLAYGDAERCLFSGNRSNVNGAGIAYGTAVYCVFSNNVAVATGGASYYSKIKNSLVVSNTADYGAGVAFGSAIGSTIVENLITSPYPQDAGVYSSAATNSIIWNNFGATGTSGLSQLWNSCAPFATSGVNGNIALAPKFVNDAAHNYRLNAGSPCINAGDNVVSVGQLDLDGNPRIVNNVLDMGAYEFQGGTPADVDADGLPDSWENQYFGNTGAGDPDADPDQDASDNLSEYISGSIPTNSTSFFAITNALPIAGNGFCVNWSPCLAGRMYSIYWAESLSDSFRELSSEIEFPQGSYTDLVHQVESNGFYKVKVELK